MNEEIYLERLWKFIVIAVAAVGGLSIGFCAGFLLHQRGLGSVGDLDQRYAEEHGRAAETIGRLTEELERERGINRELREHNQRARAISGELAETTGRNVRNLQEAVGLIGEIRAKLKVLADFYADSDTGGNGAGGVGGD